MKFKFYDTCSLLLNVDNLFNDEESIVVISSVSLDELENIKTAINKDAEVKYSARKLLRLFDEYYGCYKVVLYKQSYAEFILNNDLSLTNDSKIIACATIFKEEHPEDEVVFVTNDISCKHLASLYFGDNIESVQEEKYDYNGYKEVYLDEETMSEFYSNPSYNMFNLHINEYLLVYNKDTNECVDRVCWTGEVYRHLNYDTFSSHYFGDVKPMKGDVYQSLLADSFTNNKITMVKGPAGSGKTYLSLGYLLYLLQKRRIDRIIVFCNTVATKNSAKLGYYPGTRDEKLLDSQIGNLLASKFGGRIIVEQMI